MKTLSLALITLAAILPSVPTIPPCQTEDSTGCYWDAGHRGNGQGQSFVTLSDNTTIYLP